MTAINSELIIDGNILKKNISYIKGQRMPLIQFLAPFKYGNIREVDRQ